MEPKINRTHKTGKPRVLISLAASIAALIASGVGAAAAVADPPAGATVIAAPTRPSVLLQTCAYTGEKEKKYCEDWANTKADLGWKCTPTYSAYTCHKELD